MNSKFLFYYASISVISLLITSCSVDLPDEVQIAYDELPQELNFNIHVKPILSDKCFACHGPDKGKIEAGLQLHTDETAYEELPESPGLYAIKPGNLRKSEMFRRITASDPNDIMPPPEFKVTLSNREKAILSKWIDDGAKYEPHWAFVKPVKKDIPEVKLDNWPENEIDYFILEKLEQSNLKPSSKADKELLLRRVSLDLTGLPPTESEIEAFINDDRADSYERQVDRLIASEHFGEKMATDWMDVARYADTHGYQVDRYRNMSPWRDWVIESFNNNRSYDEFLTWQIAGDLLPNATFEQKLATGYNRLHPQNMEGGIVDEEFRVEYVADRTSVLSQGVMALTYSCARCHDHKYDPISQKNFYEMYSFFNNVNETGQISWEAQDVPVPNMLVPTKKQEEIIDYLKLQEQEKVVSVERIVEKESDRFNQWISEAGYKNKITKPVLKGKKGHFSLNDNLRNQVNGSFGKMQRKFSPDEKPTFAKGKKSSGLLLDGDAWLDLDPVGIYQRSEPFTIGIWVYLPESLKEGVIFHKNQAERLHSKKGYSLYLKDNKLELMLAHTWPDNAIIKHTTEEVPREEWFHLTMTYNGSSLAEGLKFYMDGQELQMDLEIDNLYKDIIFHQYGDVIYKKPIEPGLKIGGRWRGLGAKGAIVDDIVVYSRELSAIEVMNIAGNPILTELSEKRPDDLSESENEMLKAYYFNNQSVAFAKAQSVLAKTRTALVDSVEDVEEVMVMKEMDEPRQAYVLERGGYDSYGEEVFPNTPEEILPFPEDYEKNRVGLAKWLIHPDHPLTARVAVNRYWQNYFGRGIVNTSEDFGNQGELPSHMELLDWLAIDFMENGWDIKSLNKKIVMSATYQQSSKASDELKEIDSDNVLLARGPQVRLTSEMMRDNALLASGLLNEEIGGPSVKPYQPEGLWKMNGGTYVQDTGEDLYRRSMYTYWKRTVPHPTQGTFDQPERVECTVRRQKTNTPLQALVLLNDPAFVETSKKIGEAITKESDLDTGIGKAFRRLTGRQLIHNELEILKSLQKEEYEKFKADNERAKGWLNAGEYKIDASLDANLVAANAVVASVILNSDATITKR
ncbi:MAG: DUF1553 domain-containing protein [Reichenbachiella sp.]